MRCLGEEQVAHANTKALLAARGHKVLDLEFEVSRLLAERELKERDYAALVAERERLAAEVAQALDAAARGAEQEQQQSYIASLEAQLGEKSKTLNSAIQELQSQRQGLAAKELHISGELERIEAIKSELLDRELPTRAAAQRMAAQAAELAQREGAMKAREAAAAAKEAAEAVRESTLAARVERLELQEQQLKAAKDAFDKAVRMHEAQVEKLEHDRSEATLVTMMNNSKQTTLLEERFAEYNMKLQELRVLEAKIDAESKDVAAQRCLLSDETAALEAAREAAAAAISSAANHLTANMELPGPAAAASMATGMDEHGVWEVEAEQTTPLTTLRREPVEVEVERQELIVEVERRQGGQQAPARLKRRMVETAAAALSTTCGVGPLEPIQESKTEHRELPAPAGRDGPSGPAADTAESAAAHATCSWVSSDSRPDPKPAAVTATAKTGDRPLPPTPSSTRAAAANKPADGATAAPLPLEGGETRAAAHSARSQVQSDDARCSTKRQRANEDGDGTAKRVKPGC